jgi:hypothetical protein
MVSGSDSRLHGTYLTRCGRSGLSSSRAGSPKVSEFVGKQVDIFDEFGLEIPKGSRPGSRKKPKTGGKKKA